MVYEDKPAPGRGLLLLLNVVVAGSFLLILQRGVIAVGLNDPQTITGAVLGAIICALVYWIALNSIYRTSYRISDNTLELRCGFIYKKIRLGQIHAIQRVRGWKAWTRPVLRRLSFCNRFTDLVRLELKGDTVLLSPGDPEIFIEQLRSLMPASASGEPSGTGESR